MKAKLNAGIKAISFAVIALSGNFVRAGGMESGGGGAFVWRQENGAAIKSDLIDLWESENIAYEWPDGIHTVEMVSDSSSVDEQLQKALDRLSAVDSGFAELVKADYLYLKSNTNNLPNSVSIQLPDDLKLTYYPQGSTPEGMMRFNGLTGKLDVNLEIFSKLENNTNVAAAWMHEAIYKALRESTFAHRDSIKTRHLNACLFSNDEKCLAIVKGPDPKPSPGGTLSPDLKCIGAGGEFVYTQGRVYYQRLENHIFGSATSQVAHVDCRQPVPDYEYYCKLTTSGELQGPLNSYAFSPGQVDLQLQFERHAGGQPKTIGIPSIKFISSARGGTPVHVRGASFICTEIKN